MRGQELYFCSTVPDGSGADDGWRSITTVLGTSTGMQKLGERRSLSWGWMEVSRSATVEGSRDSAGWQLRVRPDMAGVVFGCWLRCCFFIDSSGYFEQKNKKNSLYF